ncbi:MAG: hypothetical protein QW041_00925 [Candidatus Pacearchaeota archaeon]
MTKNKEKIIEEIKDLFKKAENNPKDSQKIIKEARKKAMRVNLKLPLELRRKFCHYCNSLLKGRIRLKKGKKVIFCEKCKKFTRIPYKN